MICTILYILVSGLLTGVVSYTTLNVPDPVAVGMTTRGCAGQFPGKGRRDRRPGQRDAGDAARAVARVLLDVQGRTAAALGGGRACAFPARPGFPRHVGIFVAIFASLIPIAILGELVSIGTLLAFVIVCAGSGYARAAAGTGHPFKTPWVPFVRSWGFWLRPCDRQFAARYVAAVDHLAIGMAIYSTGSPSQPRAAGDANPKVPAITD